MPTIQEVIKDPDFLGLPDVEKQKVMSSIDQDFAGLPGEEQIKVISSFSGAPSIRGPAQEEKPMGQLLVTDPLRQFGEGVNQAAGMAAFTPALVIDWLRGDDAAKDMVGQFIDESRQRSSEATPTPGESERMGFSGRVAAGAMRTVPALMTGPGAIPLLAAPAAAETGFSAIEEGQGPATATARAINAAGQRAVMGAVPAARTIPGTLAQNVGVNVGAGVAGRGSDIAIQKAGGYKPQGNVLPKGEELGQEVAMGLGFGAQQVAARPKNMPFETAESIKAQKPKGVSKAEKDAALWWEGQQDKVMTDADVAKIEEHLGKDLKLTAGQSLGYSLAQVQKSLAAQDPSGFGADLKANNEAITSRAKELLFGALGKGQSLPESGTPQEVGAGVESAIKDKLKEVTAAENDAWNKYRAVSDLGNGQTIAVDTPRLNGMINSRERVQVTHKSAVDAMRQDIEAAQRDNADPHSLRMTIDANVSAAKAKNDPALVREMMKYRDAFNADMDTYSNEANQGKVFIYKNKIYRASDLKSQFDKAIREQKEAESALNEAATGSKEAQEAAQAIANTEREWRAVVEANQKGEIAPDVIQSLRDASKLTKYKYETFLDKGKVPDIRKIAKNQVEQKTTGSQIWTPSAFAQLEKALGGQEARRIAGEQVKTDLIQASKGAKGDQNFDLNASLRWKAKNTAMLKKTGTMAVADEIIKGQFRDQFKRIFDKKGAPQGDGDIPEAELTARELTRFRMSLPPNTIERYFGKDAAKNYDMYLNIVSHLSRDQGSTRGQSPTASNLTKFWFVPDPKTLPQQFLNDAILAVENYAPVVGGVAGYGGGGPVAGAAGVAIGGVVKGQIARRRAAHQENVERLIKGILLDPSKAIPLMEAYKAKSPKPKPQGILVDAWRSLVDDANGRLKEDIVAAYKKDPIIGNERGAVGPDIDASQAQKEVDAFNKKYGTQYKYDGPQLGKDGNVDFHMVTDRDPKSKTGGSTLAIPEINMESLSGAHTRKANEYSNSAAVGTKDVTPDAQDVKAGKDIPLTTGTKTSISKPDENIQDTYNRLRDSGLTAKQARDRIKR